ncbi:MAG TPA: hypothetical protein VFR25_09165 [Candidatus Eisenbacteria bacterium]|nr:hypothetical protein [Candidatus Eisenbacteria bacterium]
MTRRSTPTLLALLVLTIAMVVEARPTPAAVNPALTNIPNNTWVQLNSKSYDANGTDITVAGGWPCNSYSALVYDPDHRALLMFGGGGHGGRRGNDVWMYDIGSDAWRMQYFPDPETSYPYSVDDSGMTFAQYCNSTDPMTCNPSAAWLPRGTTTNKRPWTSHSFDQLSYDETNHKLVLFGPNFIFGYGSEHYYGVPDAYAYDVASKTWSHYSSIPKLYHQMSRSAYDPVHKLVVAMGRTWTAPGNSWLATAECWTLNVTTGVWTKKATPPIWGSDANLVWDSVNNVMLMYGADYPTTADLWAYDPGTDTYQQKTTLPDPTYGMPPGGAPNAAFDSAHGILLILGRSDAPYIPTWAYDVRTTRWKKMNATNEPGTDKVIIGSQLAYDPENNVFFLNALRGDFSSTGGFYGERGELYAYRYGPSAPDVTPPSAVRNLTSP